MPTFPTRANNNRTKAEEFRAFALVRLEIETITAENPIKIAFLSKLPPGMHYLILTGENVRAYRENTRSWKGPYEVTKV